jgi:glutaredoxin-like protein NrdH
MPVTVYSKPECPQCHATRRALEKHGVEHNVVDVTTEPGAREYLLGLGYMSAPVVVTDQDHWSGFRPDRIKALASI